MINFIHLLFSIILYHKFRGKKICNLKLKKLINKFECADISFTLLIFIYLELNLKVKTFYHKNKTIAKTKLK